MVSRYCGFMIRQLGLSNIPPEYCNGSQVEDLETKKVILMSWSSWHPDTALANYINDDKDTDQQAETEDYTSHVQDLPKRYRNQGVTHQLG
ncbi:uncharacterized protein RSE6_00248 [Rhynchosporium secalis]|uniref:Uncharacterized protein n=1 Tax=Rhynchosporium secalis TaxID=38038 RepID=A0A1E1LUR8_RHYSE|nr:uncharacterized protein RSE6_00248 [Rhynchosporium secalis]